MKASKNFLIISTDITPVNVRNSKSGGLISGLRSQLRHLSVAARTDALRGMVLKSQDKIEISLFSLWWFRRIK